MKIKKLFPISFSNSITFAIKKFPWNQKEIKLETSLILIIRKIRHLNYFNSFFYSSTTHFYFITRQKYLKLEIMKIS